MNARVRRTRGVPLARRRLLLVGGVATALVVAGAGTAAVLRDGDGTYPVGRDELPSAVTSTPGKAWTWTAPAEVYRGYATDDLVLLSNGDTGDTWALDHDGGERWSAHLDGGGAVVTSSEDGAVLISAGDEGYGISGISADDGEELWSFDDGSVMQVSGDVLLWTDDAEIGALDLVTGAERWRFHATGLVGVCGDAVVMLEDDELRRLSADSGETRWTVGHPTAEDDYPGIVVNDELVAVGGAQGVTAYALEDGAELWSVAGGPDGAEVGAFSATEVRVTERDDEDEDAEPVVTVHDREGERGTLDVADDGSVFFTAVEMGGRSYAYEGSTGRVYDDAYGIIGRYPGSVTFVDGGLYASEEGGVGFYELGGASPVWEIATPGADWPNVLAADGLVIVYGGDDVTAYR